MKVPVAEENLDGEKLVSLCVLLDNWTKACIMKNWTVLDHHKTMFLQMPYSN